jgi:hypothetical protein
MNYSEFDSSEFMKYKQQLDAHLMEGRTANVD